jgi:hypothetical protein
LIISGRCDHWASGTREHISILRTRHLILPNTNRPFWSRWRMIPEPYINVCPSIDSQADRAAIPSALHGLRNPVNHPLLDRICPAMMKNT